MVYADGKSKKCGDYTMEQNIEWYLPEADDREADLLCKQLGISLTLARLLVIRGINTYDQACRFLTGSLADLTDPWAMRGMAQAVARIQQGIAQGESMVIYGDYDVDGVCSTVILLQCLKRLGARVEYYIPDRFNEGYGLSASAIEKLAARGYKLVITVDTGISSVEEIKRGIELGLDIIITDHHTPSAVLPPALTIINPKLDELAECRHLAGAGVAFQLCRALGQNQLSNKEVLAWLNLAALATVADVVPLLGDNRIIVKYGLQSMLNSPNQGLSALIKASAIENKELNAWHLAFVLGPRINAAGRLKSAELAAELFLSEDNQRVHELAGYLCELNNERKAIEESVTKEATMQINNEVDLDNEKILVLGGDGWHQGVIGIVASRIAERYNRPAIIISWEEDQGKGSCRSTPGMDIYEALSENQAWLEHFGGHKLAAGLNLKRQNYEGFKAAINEWAQGYAPTGGDKKSRTVDLELGRDHITPDLIQELITLEPFGEGNPAPRFIMRGVEIESPQLMGKQREHFRCRAAGFDAVAFGRADFMNSSLEYLKQDLIFTLEEKEFRGKRSIQFRLQDIKPGGSILRYGKSPSRAQWMDTMMGQAIDELHQGNCVIIVYPTCRVLNKQKVFFSRFFPAAIVEELHGCLAYGRRIHTESRLQEQKIKICVTTRPYFEYYLSKYELPTEGYHIIQVWPAPPTADWLRATERYRHTVCQWVPGHRYEVDRSWSFKRTNRTFIYSNRPATLKHLIQEVPGIYVEVGLDALEKRSLVRQRFLSGEAGVLLSDGAYIGLFDETVVNEMVFADVPFSEYEALAVLNQIAASEDIKICATFGQEAIDFNQGYLERCYPQPSSVKSFWDWLCNREENPVTTSVEGIGSALKQVWGRVVSALEIEAMLCILGDLGLCAIEKKGSIMAIKLNNSDYAAFDPSNSPYFLEGVAEKRAFKEWLERLNKLYDAW